MAIPLAKKNFYFGFRIIDGHSVKNGSFLKLLKALSEIFSMTAKNIVLIVLRMKNFLILRIAYKWNVQIVMGRNILLQEMCRIILHQIWRQFYQVNT